MVRIIGTPLDDNLVGTSTTDDIFGLAGNDRIDGRDGNDRLFGGPGADQLLGDLGNDLLFGEDADDLLAGGPGDDMLFGGTGSDTLLGDDGADLLAGAAGVDTLLGGAGHDLLAGAADDDTVIGGAGDDVLDGGRGDNRLSGDAGADRFILTDFDVDEILDLDLGEGDVVDFSALAQQALSAGLSLGEAVRLEGGPFGTTLLVDVGDGNGFREAALLRGAEPAVEVISNGELVELARPVAVPLVSLSLADLDSSNGFRLEGIDPDDLSGGSVSGAGDVNGDSLADVIIGAEGADPNGDSSGRAYVVFGKADGTTVDLADVVAGNGGFAINGAAAGDLAGGSVRGGDINGDGLADLIVGAAFAEPNGGLSGQTYVVFGSADATTVELADVVAGTRGFAINGVDGQSGFSVGTGDVNGDGLADVIIGAPSADSSGQSSGQSYVVFGKADGTTVELADVIAGTGGFALNGVAVADGFSGLSASGAGDVDGDGLGDLIVGASGVDVNGANSGQSYVVFGKFDGTTVELADVVAGIGGFAVNGVAVGDSSGLPVVSVGDVNGDGLADVIIGATGAAPNGENSGQNYVVFGKADGGTVDLAEIVGESAVLPSTAPLPVTFPPWSVMQATSMAMALRMS